MRVIIIGGVAAGMSAASKIKRVDKDTEVIVYEKGEDLSYGACGLPYYVAGINTDPYRMIAREKSQFESQGIEIKTNCEVVKVFPDKKQVLIKDLTNGKMFIDSYDKLMIGTGCSAVKPPIKGSNKTGVYTLKTFRDGLILSKVISDNSIKNIVIVGGGYIGIELAETLCEVNKNVRVIEFSDTILRPFDNEISDVAIEAIKESGIQLNLNEKVEEILGNENVDGVETNKGKYEADIVILAIGVKPETNFLRESGINLAKNGAIIVDREMRTNIENIYAAGDCAEVYHKGKQENVFIPLGTTANKCGRIAGSNIMGKHIKYVGTLGSAAIKILNYELGRTGLSEDEIKELNIDYGKVIVKTYDHPGYYPNQTSIKIKLLYEERTHRILGAQAIGEKGVVLRIDMFAIGIHNNMTTEDLGMVDLCYAPPFAGVWDAVHIACNAVK